jgi:AcrR family transcriptional regulator
LATYFARNGYALVFALVNIYERNLDGSTFSQRIKNYGVDMRTLYRIIDRKYTANPPLLKLIFATLTLYVSHYLKTNKKLGKPFSDDEIHNIISTVFEVIEHGLRYLAEDILMIDFEKMENLIDGMALNSEPEPLLKAVAEAVAEAGPWETSMDMVAKRMGLHSKSSLYGHFKSRKDMLRRLFIVEFNRIIDYARQGIKMSAKTEEQLYLGIFSIAVYLRSRPEILVAMGWIRTRKLDLVKPDKNFEIFRLFEDIKIEGLNNAGEEERQRVSHWILFLLINILTRPDMKTDEEVQNTDIRMLYRFITLGLGGFLKNEE